MCVPCNRVVGLCQTRDRPRIFFSHCQVICPTLVVDCSSDTQWMWCPRCQRREEITSQDAPRSVVPNWFLHGPLSTMGRRYGWDQSPISPPGNGSQSWLFCPLISLALAAAQRERDVPLISVSLPDVQRDFWNSQAAQIIQLYSDHFQSLNLDSEVARAMERWSALASKCARDVFSSTHHVSSVLLVICSVFEC